MRIADGGGGGGDGGVSSASPAALISYSDSGKRIDAELETTAGRLYAALSTFQQTCLDYPTGVTTALADQLRAFAQRTAVDDVWVARVADAFLMADGTGIDLAALEGTPVSNWGMLQKLEFTFERALVYLPGDVADRLKAMLSPENLAIMAGVIGAWAVSQFAGVGEVADAAMVVIGIFTLGPDVIRVGEDVGGFALGVYNGSSQSDLDNAAKKLADAISVGGIDGALGLLFKAAGEHLPTRAPGAPVDLVTPEGFVVRVSPSEIDATTAEMSVGESGSGGGGAATSARPGELPPANTLEGKAMRWEEYQARTGGEGWDYQRWSRVYDLNLERAKQANAAADAFAQQLGFGQREVTVKVDGEPRRLDIADVGLQIGFEYKTGYQTRTADNMSELQRDAILVKQGWSINWVFQGTASEPLVRDLESAGIGVEYNNN